MRVRPLSRLLASVSCRPSMFWLGLAALGWSLLPAASRADVIVFENGGTVELPAEVKDGHVRLEAFERTLTFPMEEIQSITPRPWPSREWPERLEQARRGSAEDRLKAAWWALEHGLTDEAAALIRTSATAEPGASKRLDRLAARLDALDEPLPEPELDAWFDDLPGSLTRASGPHIVLFHQSDETGAADRLAQLERVYVAFDLLFTAQGLPPRRPNHKLVNIHFKDPKDYQRVLKRESATAFLNTSGYYHPTRRVVLTYDIRNRPSRQRAWERIEQRRQRIDQAAERLEGLPGNARVRLEVADAPARVLSPSEAQAALDRLRRDLDREALLRELDQTRSLLGVACHELVHQLVIETGLAPRYDRFPLWLHEGLALQFETIRADRWAGFGRLDRRRIDDWRDLDAPPRLDSLLNDEGFDHGYDPGRYAAAWGLVAYLRKERPQEFLTFLDLLRAPSRRSSRAAASRAAFRAAFGPDLEELERSWHRYMERLTEIAPPPPSP